MERSQYIHNIERALADVNRIKVQLQKNVTQVKSEIHSGISRQLEALRNREVWLLNQVELIQSMKDEVLHLQQARLNKMLGVAQSGMTGTMLQEMDPTEFKPDENPWIVFKCDSAKLRESIITHGRVEFSNRPHAVFVKPGHPARSLPPHFEDYGDADHHVFYKTVEGVAKSSQDIQVTFSVPNLSTLPKDWLACPDIASDNSYTPRFSFPHLGTSNQDWLSDGKDVCSGSPTSTESSGSWQMAKGDTDASIQRWLSEIKQNPAEDEEDYEVISKKDFLGLGKCQRMTISHSAPDLKACDTWLQSESKSRTTNMANPIKLPEQLVNSSTETWLCRKWKRNAKNGCGEKCSQQGPCEIENICTYLDNKVWIQPNGPSCNTKSKCKANEPCTGPDSCVAPNHCFYSISQSAYLSQDTSQWLLNGGKNVSPTTHTNMLERVAPTDEKVNMWLKSGNVQQRSLNEWKARPIEMEENVWIKQGSSDPTTPVCPSWDKVMNYHSQIGDEKWILQDSSEKMDDMKEDNPWIFTNVPTSNDKIDEIDQWIYTKMDDVIEILQ